MFLIDPTKSERPPLAGVVGRNDGANAGAASRRSSSSMNFPRKRTLKLRERLRRGRTRAVSQARLLPEAAAWDR